MVLDSLSNEQEYFSFTNKIRTEGFIPLSGGKSDLAHTAIYPTGKDSSFINNDYDKNILDIIKRRFISTFFPDLIMCRKFVTLFCSADFFILGSSNIVDQGWTEVYHFYKPEVVPIPDLKCGQKIIVKNIELLEHTTKPPSRYSFASLVREMEKISLGTKATRSDICKKLEDRGYIFTQNGSGITPTSLGKKLIEITLKYSPKISDIEMTRELEKNMDGISKGTISRSEVIEQARTTLKEILLTTTANMDSVGKELAEAMIYR
jgi:DNA topoisomerase IA